jgi:hypothetical protein
MDVCCQNPLLRATSKDVNESQALNLNTFELHITLYVMYYKERDS